MHSTILNQASQNYCLKKQKKTLVSEMYCEQFEPVKMNVA